jgi:PBSX family phage terminase large subunit
MEIKRISTGQVIYFRGGDEPNKIKSLKPPKDMHIAVVWIEEADQISGTSAMRNIKQSAFRGGDEGILFLSYNVPISQQHYMNVADRKPNSRRLLHHSHFKNAPRKWLGEAFWDEAAALLEENERAYKHEYDGEATGTGASIFENIIQREITDKEIEQFDRIYYGIDWGYYPDPFHFSEMYFDMARRTLYIYNEVRLWKSGNDNSAKEIEEYKGCKITADNAEPKSIGDFRDWGFDIRAAEKGQGSVAYSMKWLQGLKAIIIDPVRCPFTVEEFVSYEHERNKDDEIISGYPDKDNHAIDSVRYAMNEMWKKRGK